VGGLTMAPEMIAAEVFVAEQVTDRDADVIVAGCASLGITAKLRILPPRRSVSEVAWLLLVALPLQRFFGRLAENAADDAHERLRVFVNQVLRRRPARPKKCVLTLEDPDTKLQIVLEPDLPAESYRQLLSLDLTTVQRGPLHYDRQHRRWCPEHDEPDDSAAQAIPG
jgi:hypothetical protein